VNFHDPNFDIDLEAGNEELVKVIKLLAACHTIVVDEKKKSYNAASPDELALCNAAK